MSLFYWLLLPSPNRHPEEGDRGGNEVPRTTQLLINKVRQRRPASGPSSAYMVPMLKNFALLGGSIHSYPHFRLLKISPIPHPTCLLHPPLPLSALPPLPFPSHPRYELANPLRHGCAPPYLHLRCLFEKPIINHRTSS